MPTTANGREQIVKYLEEHHLSRQQLATMDGMSKQDVSDFLAGRRTNPAANRFILKAIRDLGIPYKED